MSCRKRLRSPTVRSALPQPPQCGAQFQSVAVAAELQQAHGGDAPVLLRVDIRAGHGAGKRTAKQLEETADIYAFAWKPLGTE